MPETGNVVCVEDFFATIESYLNKEQVEFVRKAYDVAAEAHASQRRKSGEPYIIHPLGVATILSQLQLDELTLAAAFLHDVVEDTEISLDSLKESFGQKVADLVDGVTKLGKIEYISKEEQQIENYRKMFLAMAKDIRVVMIKLADRLHNMRTMKFMPVHKQQSISRERWRSMRLWLTVWVFIPLSGSWRIWRSVIWSRRSIMIWSSRSRSNAASVRQWSILLWVRSKSILIR